MLEQYFRLSERGTTVRTEVLAGVTTFLTMGYIIFVNPLILSEAGIDRGAAFVATCLAAAFGSIAMGMLANLPIAQAPGMGLNAYFTYGVVLSMGHTWQVALGAVFVSGILFIIISILPIRQAIINAVPRSLKMAISAGIGLFLAIIALKGAGIVVASPATFVTLGPLTKPEPVLALLGFVVIAAMAALRIHGAIAIGILVVTVAGIGLGLSPFLGVVQPPPSLAPTFLQLDLAAALNLGIVVIVFAFLFVDLFDTAGTLIGVLHRAGLLRPDGTVPNLGKALMADSTATVVGSLLGTSTTTSYIESAAGVQAGGRTGLTAVVVGLLFILALIFAPLAMSVPAYATAPALLFVACLMARGMVEIDWEDASEYAPAVLCAVAMPLTFSIAHGIALGFITYTLTKYLRGRFTEVHPAIAILSVLFVVKFSVI